MSTFALDLMMLFLDQAGVDLDDPTTTHASWDDVQELFFGMAPQIRALAHTARREWFSHAPILLDKQLIEQAMTGKYDGSVSFSSDLAEELYRRWNWAIIGATLEGYQGEPLDLPLPGQAKSEIRGWAVILYVLAGPARNYRHDALPP